MPNPDQSGISVPMSGAGRLRRLLESPGETIMAPGVYDGITARLALNEGFKCLYMTGSGTAASVLGMPDLGLTNLSDMVRNVGMIASLDRTVPVIADADTGYGGTLMVARTVQAYMAAGVAGMHIEDQALTKRCGHLANKELVDESVFVSRFKAASMAREELRSTTGQDIVLIARTDSLQSLGYDAALSRLKSAIENGADVAFLEGITTVEQCTKVCNELAPTPVLLNMVGGGVTPYLTLDQASSIGFRIVIFPTVAVDAVLEEVSKAFKTLITTRAQYVSERTKKGGPREFFSAMGLQECVDFDVKAGGTNFSSGV
jgi:2-methylisocitrate lyase-like PEP mutase family enzyme